MAIPLQITVDARDPQRMAAFWAVALGYVLQPPLPGYVPAGELAQYTAVIDPSGMGPRVLFQRVPESKVVKNRLHLDINAGHGAVDRWGAVRRHAAQLVAAGATVIGEVNEDAGHWIVLQDPEGNEFCLQ
ncbi:VOC family protein [Pseudonocardia sp. GCM10023141]|uniref:VOC family protein n=1 Tax=Pseudonocardia sp. GCM10023141 TaxID=3252653 RepID=UPI0036099552